MKTTRLLLLSLALAAAVLALSACDLAGMLGGGTTTAPEATATPVTTESPVTTAPPVTTVPPVTTAPPVAVKENPIKAVKTLSSGAIQMTFEDNTKSNLGTAPVREGYNSVECVAYSLADGILTLTLRDSAAVNIANEFLEQAPAPLTVRIREMDGSLEWAPAEGDAWQVFSPVKPATGAASILTRLTEATEYGKVTLPTEESMIFVISGNTLRFRARSWVEPGKDFCTNAELHSAASNGNFMFRRFDVIPSSTEAGSVAATGDTLFKSADDEIPSINMNSTYISARHGYYLISAVPNAARLTEEDIGAVFTRVSDGQRYVLVKLVGESELWFCPFDDEAMASGDFGKYAFGSNGLLAAGDELTASSSLSSGTRKLSVTKNATLSQFYIATNHAEQHAYLNGTVEVDLTKDGIYRAEFVDLYEAYDVIYLPTMLRHLMDNVGWNTNDTHHDESIADAYLSYIHTHRFHKNGSYTVYQTVEIKQSLRNVHYYGVMSMPFTGSSHYVYAPGSTNVGTPTQQTDTAVEAEGDTTIRSFYQLTDPIGTKGINVGYYPHFGIATDEERPAALGNRNGVAAGQWYGSRKMYPYLFMNQDMAAGDEISFIGYHVPTVKLDDDFFAVDWYFVGDDIYLSLHTDRAVGRKFVALPNSDYLLGLTVTVDEASEGVTVHSTAITEAGIEIETAGAGYVTVKLSRP